MARKRFQVSFSLRAWEWLKEEAEKAYRDPKLHVVWIVRKYLKEKGYPTDEEMW